jgi:mannosyltransferase
MDWRDVMPRLEEARPWESMEATIDKLPPGNDLLLVRPVTENEQNWSAPWTSLVRRRSSQWSRQLRHDPRFVRRAVSPERPSGATSGVRATLYTKIRG